MIESSLPAKEKEGMMLQCDDNRSERKRNIFRNGELKPGLVGTFFLFITVIESDKS